MGIRTLVLAIAVTGCGFGAPLGGDAGIADPDALIDDAPIEPDAPRTPPRLIAGGGVGDGPIAGYANVHVIDSVTDAPLAGVAVAIGAVTATTDAAGLAVLELPGAAGKQTVVASAAAYRTAVWVGANGRNITIPLEPSPVVAPSAVLGGTITGFAAITIPSGHYKYGVVSYSQSDLAVDAANDLPQAGANACVAVPPDPANCPFSVRSRTGSVSLIAAIYDGDPQGTFDPSDDTFTVAGWGYRTGLAVTASMNQSGVTLTSTTQTNAVTASFGAAPAGLTDVQGFLGIEVQPTETAYLPAVLTPSAPTLAAPPRALFADAPYRFVAIAADPGETATSVAIRRALTTLTPAVGSWLAPPSALAITRTTGTWTAPAAAVLQTVTYDDDTREVAEVVILDGARAFTLPASVALPAGPLRATVAAIAGTLDPTSFSFDVDATALSDVASRTVPVP